MPEAPTASWKVSEQAGSAPANEATEHAQLLDRERDVRLSAELSCQRAALLVEASAMVDLSLDEDPTAVVNRLARLAVQDLCELCWIDLIEQGERLRELAIVHRDPGKEAILWEMCQRFPPDLARSLLSVEVVRSGQAKVWDLSDQAVLERFAQDEHLELLRQVAPDTLVVTPMVVRGRVVGVMGLGRVGRAFSHEEVAFCKEFADRVAGPVENARMYRAEREARIEAERSARVLRRLQENTAELAGALTTAQVAATVVKTAVDACDGTAGMLAVPLDDGEWLEIIGHQGFSEDVTAPLRYLRIEEPTPATRAYQRGEPEFIEALAEFRARYPHLAAMTTGCTGTRALLCIPLMLNGKAIGVLGVTYRADRRFSPAERVFALTLAAQCAQALDRARLYSVERRAAEHNRLLAEAGDLLSSSLDYKTTLQNVVCLAMPVLADACLLDVIEGDSVRRLVRAYANPRLEAMLRETGGEPQMAKSASQVALLDGPGIRSRITAPLLVRTETLGALTFYFAESGRHHTPLDHLLAQDLARRAAMAIENARLHRASQESTRKADQANRAKDDFLSLVSHELRAPLNAILGWSQLLRGDKGKDAATTAKALAIIERNACAQARLIEDILDVSRIISGKLRLELRPLDLEPVVRSAVEVVRPAALAKGIELKIEAAQSVIVSGDPDRLQQVVSNLLSNAVKFTPTKGLVEILLSRGARSARIVVHDTGVGIDPTLLPCVFNRFWQADSSTTRRHGGLGLGLAIVRHMVELHGGSVRVESEGADRGSTFTVELPLCSQELPQRRPEGMSMSPG